MRTAAVHILDSGSLRALDIGVNPDDPRLPIIKAAQELDSMVSRLDGDAKPNFAEMVRSRLEAGEAPASVLGWMEQILAQLKPIAAANDAGGDVRKKLGITLERWLAT